jgi:TRAP-type C4-dicarboxylate transport system permease large subunit
MTSASVVYRIVNLSQALVGHIRRRAGRHRLLHVLLRHVRPLHTDVAVLTRTMTEADGEEGYPPEFVAALIAASTIAAGAAQHHGVVYGAIGNVSIAGLFLGGVVPGFMIGIGLMIFSYFWPAGLSPPARVSAPWPSRAGSHCCP